MSARPEERLVRLLKASEAAGKVVQEAIVGPDGIRLVFAGPGVGATSPEDFIDWRPKAKR